MLLLDYNTGMIRNVFVTGSTGFIGQALCRALLSRGHRVRGLVRPGSERRLVPGVTPVLGDPLNGKTFAQAVRPGDIFVQLVGVSHPSPAKARQFQEVDGRSAAESLRVAQAAGVSHFVFLSVAMPAPIMRAYVEVRRAAEEQIRTSGLPATFVRPWYVVGPGRRWPLLVKPFYWLLEALPATRRSAQRLGLVTVDQMTAALVRAIEGPPAGIQILEVPAIRAAIPRPGGEEKVRAVLSAIDDFNRQDPHGKELPYSERLSAWAMKRLPEASELLRIAARGQHVGRWTIPRDRYPMDRTGYLRWREDLKRFHSSTVAGFMEEAGYAAAEIERVRSMMLKKNLQTDPEAQALEDALCLLFLETQFDELREKTPDDKMIDILQKTWRKMSDVGRRMALDLPLPPDQGALVAKALTRPSPNRDI